MKPELKEELSETEKEQKIKELRNQKTALLDKYGIFGGGSYVNQAHLRINAQLEALGVDPNS